MSVALAPRNDPIASPGKLPSVCHVAPSHASTPEFFVATNTESEPAAHTSEYVAAGTPSTVLHCEPSQCATTSPTAQTSSVAVAHAPARLLPPFTGNAVQLPA